MTDNVALVVVNFFIITFNQLLAEIFLSLKNLGLLICRSSFTIDMYFHQGTQSGSIKIGTLLNSWPGWVPSVREIKVKVVVEAGLISVFGLLVLKIKGKLSFCLEMA